MAAHANQKNVTQPSPVRYRILATASGNNDVSCIPSHKPEHVGEDMTAKTLLHKHLRFM